ncbi:hypothetical protein NHQ30_010756 [Ciborinia camelliae]|nr:hypothetical protein NHQ30_010756 [Ciborinia camelliae]
MSSTMAPQVHPAMPIHNGQDGPALEETADKIEELNRIRQDMKRDLENKSKFDAEKDKTKFRQYEEAEAHVKEFYKEQHEKQTYDYNVKVREKFENRKKIPMGIWEAMQKLEEFVDNSDPDTSVTQIEHLLQTAEAMRRDGRDEALIVAGLVHDLGKLWMLHDAAGQWEVVGDTFPVGCQFSKDIKLYDSFKNNPDFNHPVYSTKYGIYSKGCGLDNLMISWGHDEYLYLVLKDQCSLPPEALAMIRYHSFYPWHTENAYEYFMNEEDHKTKSVVLSFNPYDLYSKSDNPVKVEEIKVRRSATT